MTSHRFVKLGGPRDAGSVLDAGERKKGTDVKEEICGN